MPAIRRLQQPQVESQTIRPVYIDPSRTAGRDAAQLSRGLAGISQVAGEIADRETAIEADTANTEVSSAWLKWDAENRGKFAGANSNGYEKAAADWWDAAAKDQSDKLSPRARARVGPVLGQKRASALVGVAQWVNTERDKHADNVAAAQIDAEISFGVTNMQPAAAADRIRTITAETGARKGWTTEQVQAKQREALAGLHVNFIARLAETDAVGAQAYFQKAQAAGEIDAGRQAQIEKVLKAETDNQAATQFAASVASKPFGEQLADAAKIEDPQRREKAIQRINENQTLARAATEEKERQASDLAWQMVGQGRRVPEAVLSTMDGKERVQLQDYLRERAKKSGSEAANIKTDVATHAALWDKMVNDPEGFKTERLLAYRLKLSQSDYEQLVTKQQAMRGAKAPEIASAFTLSQRIDGGLQAAGIDDKKDPQGAYTFRTAVDRAIQAASVAKGKPLTPDEEQRAVDGVTMNKVFTPRTLLADRERPAALVPPDELVDAYVKVDGKDVKVSVVPAGDRALIMESLKRAGITPTEQAIVQTFLDRQARDKARAAGARPIPGSRALGQ